MAETTLLDRAAQALERFSALKRDPRLQRAAWGVAVLLFVGGLSAALAANPQLLSQINAASFVIIALVIAPALTLCNMITVKISAALAGAEFCYPTSLKISVAATAANHLPVPGGPVLRIAAMRGAGADLKQASLSTLAAGMAWMSATLVFGGLCALTSYRVMGGLFLAGGLILAGVAFRLAYRLPGGARDAARLAAVSFCAAALYAGAVYLAMNGLGEPASFAQASIIAAAGVLGAAVSIVPSGLGVREAAAAGLAYVIGVSPASAFTVSALLHLVIVSQAALIALFFAFKVRPVSAR